MQSTATSIVDFVEQRTALLVALADALAAASASVVGFDLDGLESRLAQQQKLCAEIAQLDRQIDSVHERMTGASSAPSTNLLQPVSRLREAQARVKFLNDQHQALLRRSRRTVNALMRSYQTFAADLYENPAASGSGAGETA